MCELDGECFGFVFRVKEPSISQKDSFCVVVVVVGIATYDSFWRVARLIGKTFFQSFKNFAAFAAMSYVFIDTYGYILIICNYFL